MDIPSEFETSYESTNEEFTVTRVNPSVVIGETHVRTNPSDKEDKRFNNLLEENKDSIFVLESEVNWRNTNIIQGSYIFSETESYNTFMTQASQFAKENNIRLEILENERMSSDRFGIWKDAGSDFSVKDFDTLNAMYLMRMFSSNQSLEQLVDSVISSKILDESRKQTYLNGFFKYARILQSDDAEKKLESIDMLLHSFIQYDSICRERYYQKEIADIQKENPDKKIFAVFGKSHTEGISKTLQDSEYRTNLPPIAKTKWLMGSI